MKSTKLVAVLFASSLLVACGGSENLEEEFDEVFSDPAEEEVQVSENALIVGHCNHEYKTFELPGKPNIRALLYSCLQVSNNVAVRALIRVHWDNLTPVLPFHDDYKFSTFQIVSRLERGTSTVVRRAVCGRGGALNSSWDGHVSCTTAWQLKGGSTWSADGSVVYDIANDGVNLRTWSFTGSPVWP